MDLGLAGHVAIVTGGTRGIGRAICTTLISQGCDVSLCARDRVEVEETLAALNAGTARASGSVADVTIPGQLERFIEETAARAGHIHHLVANVGGTIGQGSLDASAEEWTRTFDLNAGHAIRAIRTVVPHMRTPEECSIVVISSISGSKPGPRAQYGAAKAAEIFLAQALARDLGPRRIRINAVSPGSILFPGGGWDRFRLQQAARFEEFVRQQFPWQRLGTVEEVADVVAFVLSPRARWINGTNIAVDGAQNYPSAI